MTHDCSKYSELISAYIDGELSPDENAELNGHLSECDECRKKLQLMSQIHEAAGDLQEQAPASLAASVMRSVSAHEKSKKRFSFANFKFTAIAAAAVLLVLAASRLPAFEPMFAEETEDNSVAVSEAGSEAKAHELVPSVLLPAGDSAQSKPAPANNSNTAALQHDSTQRSSTAALQKEDAATDTSAPVEERGSAESADDFSLSNKSYAPSAGGGSSSNPEATVPASPKPPLPQIPYSQDFSFYILVEEADAISLFSEYSAEIYQGSYLIILPAGELSSTTTALTENKIKFWEYEGNSSAQNGLIILRS